MAKKSSKNTFKIFYAFSIAMQLGFFIAIPIGGFLFLGFYLDKFFHTNPFFILLGMLVGSIITFHEVYNLFIPLILHKEKKDEH